MIHEEVLYSLGNLRKKYDSDSIVLGARVFYNDDEVSGARETLRGELGDAANIFTKPPEATPR